MAIPADSRHQLRRREQLTLAPYAFASDRSRGRRHPEPEHPYRGPFQRDRDRILHSSAFRRLSGKMQVFTGEFGDYHRTRLTHTMEVASVARTIGRVLRLNEDLIEALALLHDLGHPPFGHAGEDALRDCLAQEGGFSHNVFALTLVEELESRYSEFPGLNLSVEVLEGQRFRVEKPKLLPHPLLEVQVVEAADGMAYNAHDVDDALKLELVTVDELRQVPLVGEILHDLEGPRGRSSQRELRTSLVRRILDRQVTSLLMHCSIFLQDCGWTDPGDAVRSEFTIDMEPHVADARRLLAAFLARRIYRHERLMEMRQRAQAEIHSLFEYLTRHAETALPAPFAARGRQVGIPRSAAEYIAGMTDRYCRRLFMRYIEPGASSVAE